MVGVDVLMAVPERRKRIEHLSSDLRTRVFALAAAVVGNDSVGKDGDENEPGYSERLPATRGFGKRRKLTCVERTSSARSER